MRWASAERVRRTVRHLRTFSRPDSDTKGPVDLERILGAAVSMARTEVLHRAHLSADFASLPLVVGEESQLAQVAATLPPLGAE